MTTDTVSTEVNEIPLRDFFRHPEKTGYDISPDGKYLSYLAPHNSRLNIFVEKIESGETNRITNEKDRDISDYFWSNDNRILFLKDTDGDENFKLYAIDKDGKNPKNLTPFDKVNTQIVDQLEEIENEILVGLNKRDPRVFDVYRLNIETGEMKLAAENPGNILDWVTDHDGLIRVATSSDGVNTTLLYRDNEEEDFKEIVTLNFKDALSPIFFTFDNKHIYASSNIGRDKKAIVKYDVKNGKELETIFEHPDVDVTSLLYSRKRKVLTSIVFFTSKREIVFIDEASKKRYERIKNELGDVEIYFSGNNKNEDKFLIRTYSDRSLGAYYFYDTVKDELTKIASVSPWINEDDMSEMKIIQYTSRDGLTINGYLTLPKNKDPQNLPVVVNVHGGPWARNNWGYSPEVQFLANRGYAVLQVNFRGSTGFGKKFWEASFKQWGLTMQDDISDGVNWLIEKGIADPKRIAIYGGSYGGYATLAGLAFSPDLYACGVDFVGVSNLFTFMDTIPPYWEPLLGVMHEMVGHPERDKELLEKTSPVLHADKIKAPLFIAQGRMDPRVNVNESDQMVAAMKKRGVDVEYMVKDNEGHGFHNEENRFEFYDAMENFLKKHL